MDYMDFYGDFTDDDLLADVPCEFCNDPYPLYRITEHQTGCRPDLVRVIKPTVEEIESQFINLETSNNEDRSAANSPEIPNPPDLPQQSIPPIVDAASSPKLPLKKTIVLTTQQNDNREELPTDDHFEILEDDIDQDNKTTFTFGSSKQGKREEEVGKPSFKASLNPLLNDDSKQLFHNQLPESDNEDNESLEDFWKRADIKLSQRLRMIEKKTAVTKT